eukprot:CAMPEP_0168850246 /NCGR_PEP_ID=MMETSP0727-20121128/11775_1 /TAXON_ID=265536 /ORGANISM="Amphiprora sp., Strain CCMP467" /LENGTH=423 /DNA_ID=CAMNT_0008904157 /DNA_START=39 /DNA_END=1308 /DNA_ORIENTATION=-
MSPNNEDSRKEEVQNPEQPIDNSGGDKDVSDEDVGEDEERQYQGFFTADRDLGLQPGDEGFDEENAAVPFVLNEWAGGTSIHGVANIVDGLTWSWWKRCVWFVLVCCSASFMIWQITTLIQEYRNFEVLTETVTITPTAMDFPEITICDINDISRSKVEAAGLTRGPRNETELFQLSKTVEDLIGITIFNDEEFPDPTKVWSPVITFQGLCWQFSPKDRVVQRPGVHAGLWFSANLDPSDNLADSVISGLTLYAEQPGTPINDELASVMVEPGSDALVHIKKTDFHRERVAPWAVCRGDAPEYTETACRSICLMEEIRQTCGCRDKGDFTYDVETMGPLDYCGASETLSSEASNPVKYKTFDSCPNLEPEETILVRSSLETVLKSGTKSLNFQIMREAVKGMNWVFDMHLDKMTTLRQCRHGA